MSQHKVIISGGGTGGHIFPAIAIANALKEINSNIDILFVGAQGKMEMEKVPEAGYKIEGLWISGLQRKLTLKNFSFPFKVISSLIKARSIVKKFKPDAVVGTGGYASGPVLKIAAGRKIPTLIQEQNSFPGITNKLLAKQVNKVCVAFDGMDKFFPKEKIVLTGNPVREEVVKLEGKKARAMEFFGLDENKKIVLIVGGSLGARSVNLAIMECMNLFKENNIQVIWQTGKPTYEQALKAAKPFEEHGIKVHEFIKKMDYAYAAADVVISRAGAIAVSELCLTGKPCILVPFPYAAEDHQTKNALALVTHNAAILVKDSDAKKSLGKEVISLLEDEEKQQSLAKNISGLAQKDSAKLIANEVMRLIQQ